MPDAVSGSDRIPSGGSAELDLVALRAKYRAERDRRIRADGAQQYRATEAEFGSYAEDPYLPSQQREPLHDQVEVVVLGGGFGGLLAGARLRQVGIDNIRMIDDGGDFGGTWYWNRYPGIHCDVESYIYLPLLEEVGSIPEWKYAPGEEIRQHCRAIARHFDLYRDACFHTKVTELRWDDDTDEWVISTDRGDRMRARYVITATGTLSRAKLPGIPGLSSFKGHAFHTSRWDYEYTGGNQYGGLEKLADKRVALIGTGATAIQVVPHLARSAAQLYVFQRTPSSVDVRGQQRTDPQWAASLAPGWHKRRRDNFLGLLYGGGVEGEDLVADAWTARASLQQTFLPGVLDDRISLEQYQQELEIVDFEVMNELRARVDSLIDDPATAELLKPWYRYMCKRPTFSDEYLQTFNRSNVSLVDTAPYGGVERITETAVVVGDREYEVDCLIFATGFESGGSGILSTKLPMYGRGGKHLFEVWMANGGPRTLHGLYSNGFPNLFNLGSLQNARAVTFTHLLDEQATHVAEVLAEAKARSAVCVEPTREAEEAWVALIKEKSRGVMEFQADCTPGYWNGEGMPNPFGEPFGDGPVVFHELLRQWRLNGGFDEVLT